MHTHLLALSHILIINFTNLYRKSGKLNKVDAKIRGEFETEYYTRKKMYL